MINYLISVINYMTNTYNPSRLSHSAPLKGLQSRPLEDGLEAEPPPPTPLDVRRILVPLFDLGGFIQ